MALARIGNACRDRLSEGERGIPTSVNTYRSQVLFPVEGGQYVVLSPLYPYAVGAELAARLHARQWAVDPDERQRFDVRVTHVGGKRPQNNGLLATYLAGRFPRLAGTPPRSFSRRSTVVRRFATTGVPIADGSVSKGSLSVFESALALHHAQPNAAEAQGAMDSAIGAMCLDILSPLAEVGMANDFALATTGLPIFISGELPTASREIAMILGMLENEPDEDDIARMAQAVAAAVAAHLHGKVFRTKDGPRPVVVDASIMDILTAIARQKLKEYV
jgi:hypothetical protein